MPATPRTGTQKTFNAFLDTTGINGQPQTPVLARYRPSDLLSAPPEVSPLAIFEEMESGRVYPIRSAAREEFDFPLFEETGKPSAKHHTEQCLKREHNSGVQTSQSAAVLDESELEAALDELLYEEGFPDLSPGNEPWLVRFFNRPKLAIGIIGLCVLASSVYAGMAYWWLISGNASIAAEPIHMMQIHEGPKAKPSMHPGLNHLNTLQAQPPVTVPEEKTPQKPETEPATLLAQANMPSLTTPSSGTEIAAKDKEPELTGRFDPFEPLVRIADPNQETPEDNTSAPPKDVLEDVQYTGFVGNANAKNKLAILKITDPSTGSTQTLIKKAGTSFYVGGEKVILKSISKKSLQLSVSGQNRQLDISPYQTANSTTSASSGTNNTPAAGPGIIPPSSAGGGPGFGNTGGAPPGNLSNLGALSNNGSRPENPQLMEPGR
jgi:hypothetical protein